MSGPGGGSWWGGGETSRLLCAPRAGRTGAGRAWQPRPTLGWFLPSLRRRASAQIVHRYCVGCALIWCVPPLPSPPVPQARPLLLACARAATQVACRACLRRAANPRAGRNFLERLSNRGVWVSEEGVLLLRPRCSQLCVCTHG